MSGIDHEPVLFTHPRVFAPEKQGSRGSERKEDRKESIKKPAGEELDLPSAGFPLLFSLILI